jgi:murein DD-endopeptidase MepM/ murein hydrolase activator NlpD
MDSTTPFSGAENPFTAGAASSPLASNWSGYFANQIATKSWWKNENAPYSYGADFSSGSDFDYDPGSSGSPYGPTSSMTMRIIYDQMDNWLAREHPELFDFTSGLQYGGVGGAGTVAQDPGFGQFSKHPEVYAEIQAAASKYGVPANFLQAIIAKESSGDWDSNSSPVCGIRGMCIHGYVGVFENAASSWGFNFDSLSGNRAGQIEMLASGLRGFYDKLHAQNPKWGWANVASYHYSGIADPYANTWSDESGNGTNVQYVEEVLDWWKALDAKAGNTWSNYTDPGQTKGIGSPQNQAWGQYAEWDQAITGMASATGVPANLMKAVLRYGDEAGFGFSSEFDTVFSPVATQIQTNYTQVGSWDQAAASALGIAPNSQQWNRVKSYWDELNADMSGVFGGPATGTSAVVGNQFEAVWGGVEYGVSQEANSVSDFVYAHPDWYDYSIGLLGHLAHPGMDIVFGRGTPLYTPAAGTVIIAGGTTGYSFYGNGSPGVGQLRIRLDNGDELILGHMMRIDVHEGDRVTPGMAMGVSGGDGTGDHLHLEYRTPSTQFSSGWTSVDPRVALGGTFSGYTQGARTGLGYTQALTFQNLMRAGASGQPIPSGATFVQGGGRSAWTNWLRKAMMGTTTEQSDPLDYSRFYTTSPGDGF